MAAKTKTKKVKKTPKTQPKPLKVKTPKPKTKVKTKKSTVQANKSFSFQEVRKQIKLDESYVSLVLGFLVVLVFFIAAIFFLKGEKIVNDNNQAENTPAPAASNSATMTPTAEVKGKTYVVGENESLWDIAVREYGDGFAYVKIIEANNFENPDYVPPGTKIVIPPAN